MNFKNLYFALLGVLVGLLAAIFFASTQVDKNRYGDAKIQEQFIVVVGGKTQVSTDVQLHYSKRIYKTLHLPYVVGGVIGLGLILGLVVDRKNKNRKQAAEQS